MSFSCTYKMVSPYEIAANLNAVYAPSFCRSSEHSVQLARVFIAYKEITLHSNCHQHASAYIPPWRQADHTTIIYDDIDASHLAMRCPTHIKQSRQGENTAFPFISWRYLTESSANKKQAFSFLATRWGRAMVVRDWLLAIGKSGINRCIIPQSHGIVSFYTTMSMDTSKKNRRWCIKRTGLYLVDLCYQARSVPFMWLHIMLAIRAHGWV